MYYDQIDSDEHFYRLRFSDGQVHRGTAHSDIHFCILILFYEEHVKEEIFADRLKEKSIAEKIPIDDLIENEIELYDDYHWKSESYYSNLINGPFYDWLIAREKLLNYDEAKHPLGYA